MPENVLFRSLPAWLAETGGKVAWNPCSEAVRCTVVLGRKKYVFAISTGLKRKENVLPCCLLNNWNIRYNYKLLRLVWYCQCIGVSVQPSWESWVMLVHSSVRPTTYLMMKKVKLWFKLPIWPELLKLCLCSASSLGPFPLLCSSRHLWSQKTKTVYLHMN